MKTIYIHFIVLLSAMSGSVTHFADKTNSSLTVTHKTNGINLEPSDLINFEAVKKDGKVELFWDVKNERHHDFFTLERSKNGVDFEKIATIDAGGNTNNLIQYIETDNKPLKGKAYYRVKLTDIKNRSTYSNVIVVNSKENNSFPSRQVNKSDLEKIGNTPVLVVLKDTNGREHYSKVQVKTEDSNIVGTDKENRLTPGTYTIKATSQNSLYSQKLIVR